MAKTTTDEPEQNGTGESTREKSSGSQSATRPKTNSNPPSRSSGTSVRREIQKRVPFKLPF
jgi:hypothetical protein